MPPRPPSRRTTLGPVNRRTSLGPSNDAGGAKKKKASKQRMSMIPRMSGGGEPLLPENKVAGGRKSSVATPSRRKSHGGGDRRRSFAPPAVKADPRPLSDKAYINSCIRSLLGYLVSSGYEYPVSHKTLARPSGRDFNQIVTFLLRRIDPTFNDGMQKFEDEVALAFKTLGYPYPISKTALVAAGSPHTWPTLLAALTWLIELLGCEEAADDDEEDDIVVNGNDGDQTPATLEEIEARSERAFFGFLGDSYSAFLAADDARYGALEEALIEYFEKDNIKIEQEFAALSESNVALGENIKNLLSDGEALPELKKRREDYATDLEKFYDLVKKLEEHKAALAQKVEERTAELAKKEKDLGSITTRVEAQKERVQTQELSVEDVRMMQNEKARVEEGIANATKSKNEQNKISWEGENELRGKIEELQIAVDKYNELASKLLMIPETAGNAGGEKFEIEVQKDAAREEDQSMLLGGVDLERRALRSISKLKDEYEGSIAQSRQELLVLLDEQEASEEAYTEASDGVKILEAKVKKCEEILRREKDEQEGTLAVRLREIDSVETKIGSLRDPVALEAAIAKYQRQCTQLETLRQKHQEENVAKKKAVREELNDALAMLADRQEHIQMKFKELENHIRSKEASLLELTPFGDATKLNDVA